MVWHPCRGALARPLSLRLRDHSFVQSERAGIAPNRHCRDWSSRHEHDRVGGERLSTDAPARRPSGGGPGAGRHVGGTQLPSRGRLLHRDPLQLHLALRHGLAISYRRTTLKRILNTIAGVLLLFFFALVALSAYLLPAQGAVELPKPLAATVLRFAIFHVTVGPALVTMLLLILAALALRR